MRLGVSVKDLVNRLYTMPANVCKFESATWEVWEQRVRRWCDKHKLSLRKPNTKERITFFTSYPEQERQKIAERCLGTLGELARVRDISDLELKKMTILQKTSLTWTKQPCGYFPRLF